MAERPTDPVLALWRRLLRHQRRVASALDAELRSAHELSLEEHDALAHLAEATGNRLRMSELADALLLARSSCTRLIDRLEHRDLVARGAGPSDRREVWVTLTAAGRALHRRAAVTHLRTVQHEFAEGFDATDLKALKRALDHLDRAAT